MLLTLPIHNINRIGGKYHLLQATLRPVSCVGGSTRLPSPIRQTLIVFIVISTSICILFHLTLPVVQDCIASPSILFQVHATPSAPFRRKTVAFICLFVFHFWGICDSFDKSKTWQHLAQRKQLFSPPTEQDSPAKEKLCSCLVPQSDFLYRCQSSINCFYSYNAMWELTWAGRKVWASKSWWLQTRCKSDSQHTVKILSTIFLSILESESSFNSKFNFKMVKRHSLWFLSFTDYGHTTSDYNGTKEYMSGAITWHGMRCGHGLPTNVSQRGWSAPITKFFVESLVNGNIYSRSPGLKLWLQAAQTC